MNVNFDLVPTIVFAIVMLSWFAFAAGLVAVVAAVGSVLLIKAAIKTLGKEWSVTARMLEGHQLATKGPYA